MKLKTADGGWNPYFAGALLGVLAIMSTLLTTNIMNRTRYLGASTTFVRAAGYLQKPFAAQRLEDNEYYRSTAPRLDWQYMLVIGVLFGALAGSLTDKSFKKESVPPIWRERFGSSVGKRAAGAIGGGMLAMVGARMADGCPSGHGLSGMMQLSVSGFVALACFFGSGIIVAHFLYGGRKND